MAQLPSKFNADEHEEMGSYDAIPQGEYELKVSGNKKKDNKAKVAAAERGDNIPGSVYTITFEITSGEYKGRLLFMGLNLEHTSAQTTDIAFRELASLTKACGKVQLKDNDLDDLIGCELLASVGVVPATAQYPASNKVKSCKPLKNVAVPSAPPKKKSNPKVSFD